MDAAFCEGVGEEAEVPDWWEKSTTYLIQYLSVPVQQGNAISALSAFVVDAEPCLNSLFLWFNTNCLTLSCPALALLSCLLYIGILSGNTFD